MTNQPKKVPELQDKPVTLGQFQNLAIFVAKCKLCNNAIFANNLIIITMLVFLEIPK